MYTVYAFATPNSVKVPLALEELGLPYELKRVNIRAGEQKTPEFLALNPNGKVPLLVTPKGQVISESAAILVHLAETTGRLLPAAGPGRSRVFEQLFFHASAIGPAFGNAGYFQKLAAERYQPAIDRFVTEARRTLAVLDQQLAASKFVAGDELSIADIAHFGWIWRREFAGVDFSQTPHVARWYEDLGARPAFERAVARTQELANPAAETKP